MALPDLTGLTRGELVTLSQQINTALREMETEAADTQATLLDPAVVAVQIDQLLGQVDAVQAVIDTPNSEIKANPQTHVVALARAQKRTINNLIRVLRTSAGVLDSADVGD